MQHHSHSSQTKCRCRLVTPAHSVCAHSLHASHCIQSSDDVLQSAQQYKHRSLLLAAAKRTQRQQLHWPIVSQIVQ